MKSNILKYSLVITWVMVVAFYLFQAWTIPMMGDDWIWGGNVGIDRLHSFFADYNGRYLGNVVELLVTRFFVARLLILTTVNTLILYFLVKLTGKITVFKIALAFLGLLVMPTALYSQTYGWLAGFSNYNLSVFFMLLNLLILQRLIFSEKPLNWISNIGMFLIVLVGQLIMENVTLFNILLGFLVLIILVVSKKKQFLISIITYLVSSVIGAVAMFSNGAYSAIASGKDTYRTVSENASFFTKIFDTFTGPMYHWWYYDSNRLIGMTAILMLVFLFTSKTRLRASDILAISLVMMIFVYQLIIINLLGWQWKQSPIMYGIVQPAMTILLVVLLLFLAIHLWKDLKMVISVLFSGFVSAPLFFVTPLNARIFLPSYIFLLIFMLLILDKIIDNSPEAVRALSLLSAVPIVAFTSMWLVLMTMNYNADQQRTEYVASQIKQKKETIYTYGLPASWITYLSNPGDRGYMHDAYKKYYGIQGDLKVEKSPQKFFLFGH